MNPGDGTLQFYESHADSFAAGTYSADMSAAADRFIACLPERARILDFGCGAGRGDREAPGRAEVHGTHDFLSSHGEAAVRGADCG